MPERRDAFPFAAVRHVPTRADYRVHRHDSGRRKLVAIVTVGTLQRADRALRWHERRAQQRGRDGR